jgi:hypothetical protein
MGTLTTTDCNCKLELHPGDYVTVRDSILIPYPKIATQFRF